MSTTVADYLHTQIFGRHYHLCTECHERKSCSQQYCQPGPQWCEDCAFEEDEKYFEPADYEPEEEML